MATRLISASTFRDPILRTLGTLTTLQANVPVARTDVLSGVLSQTGYQIGQFGTTGAGKDYLTWAIGRAYFLAKRDEQLAPKKMKRGFWGLSEQGVEVARVLLTGLGASASEVATEVAPNSECDQGVVFNLVTTGQDRYHEDPYIRSVAIQSTGCCGSFSRRSAVCADCPLVVSCKSRRMSNVSALAATLRKRDADAIRKAKEEAERVAQAAKTQAEREAGTLPGTRATDGMVHDEAIDDILAELERGSTPAVSEGQLIEAVVPTLCCRCDDTIRTGTKCRYTVGQGVYHYPSCP